LTNATDHLISLGFKQYEAKVVATLAPLGLAGVAEIHRLTNIPRNKVYETLDTLTKRGIVEVRPGRPRIFRLIPARTMIEQLTEQYNRTAKEALELLDEETTRVKLVEESDYVWIVKGDRTSRQRFAGLIADAKNDIFILEPFPPKYLSSYRAILTAAKRRDIRVRAVSIADHIITENPPRDRLVEYRLLNDKTDEIEAEYDATLLRYLRKTLQTVALIAVVDNERALLIAKGVSEVKNITGIFLRIPGVPAMQKATLQRMLTLFTKSLSHS